MALQDLHGSGRPENGVVVPRTGFHYAPRKTKFAGIFVHGEMLGKYLKLYADDLELRSTVLASIVNDMREEAGLYKKDDDFFSDIRILKQTVTIQKDQREDLPSVPKEADAETTQPYAIKSNKSIAAGVLQR